MSVHFPNRAERDKVWDLIPIVSTFSNAQNIYKILTGKSTTVNKPASTQLVNQASSVLVKSLTDYTYNYLKTKSILRCIFLAIPVLGNIGVPIFDFFSNKYALNRVKADGLALKDLSPRLRNNEKIVRAAIEQNGLAFRYASDRLRNNASLAISAIRQNKDAFLAASQELRQEPWLRALRFLDEEDDQLDLEKPIVYTVMRPVKANPSPKAPEPAPALPESSENALFPDDDGNGKVYL